MSATTPHPGRPRRSSVRTTRDGRVRPARLRSVQWPMVVWLTLVWWVLWGSWTAFSLVGGVVVALVVSLVFPLPPLRLQVRVRPVGVVVLVGRFLADVVVASLQVARTVLRPPPGLRNAVVAVPLRTESDVVLAVVAELVSLVPGSLVVEAHRPSHTLYLHVLDVADEASLAGVRDNVWAQEARVLRAFGVDPVDPVDPVVPVAAVAPRGGGAS